MPKWSSAKWGEVCEKGKKKNNALARGGWSGNKNLSRMPKAQGGVRVGLPALVPVQRSEYSALQRNVGRRSCCAVAVTQRAVASGAKQRAALSLSGGIAKAASRKTQEGDERWENIASAALGCG